MKKLGDVFLLNEGAVIKVIEISPYSLCEVIKESPSTEIGMLIKYEISSDYPAGLIAKRNDSLKIKSRLSKIKNPEYFI